MGDEIVILASSQAWLSYLVGRMLSYHAGKPKFARKPESESQHHINWSLWNTPVILVP